MAYVWADTDAEEYTRLLADAEKAIETETQPFINAQHGRVYAALDAANANWAKAVIEILDTRPMCGLIQSQSTPLPILAAKVISAATRKKEYNSAVSSRSPPRP